jgi:hypothetical protein
MFRAIGNGSTIAAASGKTRAHLLTRLFFANKRLRIIKPPTKRFLRGLIQRAPSESFFLRLQMPHREYSVAGNFWNSNPTQGQWILTRRFRGYGIKKVTNLLRLNRDFKLELSQQGKSTKHSKWF